MERLRLVKLGRLERGKNRKDVYVTTEANIRQEHPWGQRFAPNAARSLPRDRSSAANAAASQSSNADEGTSLAIVSKKIPLL